MWQLCNDITSWLILSPWTCQRSNIPHLNHGLWRIFSRHNALIKRNKDKANSGWWVRMMYRIFKICHLSCGPRCYPDWLERANWALYSHTSSEDQLGFPDNGKPKYSQDSGISCSQSQKVHRTLYMDILFSCKFNFINDFISSRWILHGIWRLCTGNDSTAIQQYWCITALQYQLGFMDLNNDYIYHNSAYQLKLMDHNSHATGDKSIFC